MECFHIMVCNTIIWIPLKFQLMVSVHGFSPWFQSMVSFDLFSMGVPAQFSQPCMAPSGSIMESAESGGTIYLE